MQKSRRLEFTGMPKVGNQREKLSLRLLRRLSSPRADLETVACVLGEVGQFSGSERCNLFWFETGGRLVNLREWCAPGIPSQYLDGQALDLENFPWLRKQLSAVGWLAVARVDQLPAPAWRERAYWQKLGVQSLLIMPLAGGSHPLGLLCLQTCTSLRQWRRSDGVLLRLAGQAIGSLVEHRRAQEALRLQVNTSRRLSQEFRALLDALPDAVMDISPQMEILWINRAALRYAHLREGKRFCYEILYDRRTPCRNCPVLQALQSGQADERESVLGDRVASIRTFPMLNEQGEVESVIVQQTDITQKLKFQQESLRSSHLASLGELAASVAHEINNPINGIINYAQLLADNIQGQLATEEIPQRILLEGGRIAAIVGNLLKYSRGQGESKEPLRLAAVLEAVLALSRAQLGKDRIRLQLEIEDELPLVHANFQQIQQVFFNLISNARYALTEKSDSSEKLLHISVRQCEQPQGVLVRTTFRDNGCGIPAEVLPKIFTPFFTTKPPGRGTGLGLSICQQIISSHGGFMHIDSTAGQGTAVDIDLPVQREGELTDGRAPA
jgi:two-component system, NtrC family, sensor kinase